MEMAKISSHRLNSAEDLFDLLGFSENEIRQAVKKDYKRYKKFKNGKYRWIEAPNDDLKLMQQRLLEYLQEYLKPPPYCMAGFKGQNNIKNAMRHRFKREVITTDISHCFPNTQAKYVEKFFVKEFGATGKLLELLLALTTYNGYLPTGAPTSTLLVCFAHKDIFDSIYKKMQALDVDMSVFVDDITISTHKHIGNWVVPYLKNALKTNGLHIKKAKTKRYGYRYAVVTGVHIAQCGKLSAPFEIGYSIIEILRKKEISTMTEKELQGIIAKIGYINQFGCKKMLVTKSKAIKQLKRLNKKMRNKENERN